MGDLINFSQAIKELIKPQAIPRDESLKIKLEAYTKNLHGRYTAYKAAGTTDHEKLLKAWYDYCNIIDDTLGWEWEHNVQVPMVLNNVKVWMARAIESIAMTPNIVNIRPYGYTLTGGHSYEEMEFRARLLEKVVNTGLRLGGFQVQAMNAMLNAAIYGRTITKQLWAQKMRPDGSGGEELIAEHPDMKCVSPFNFYVDPFALDVQKARDTYEVLETSREDLEDGIRDGFYIKEAAANVTWVNPNDNSEKQERNDKRFKEQPNSDAGYCNVIEAWAFWDPDGDGVSTLWRVFFDETKGTLLGASENPFGHGLRPYSVGVIIPVPEQLYGIGIPELLHGLLVTQTAFINQILDNLAASANQRHLILDGDIIDELEFKRSIPNGIVHTQNLDAWKPIQAVPLSADVWRIQDFINIEGQKAGGATDIAMALKAPSTAFASNMMGQASQMNFDIFTTWLSRTWLEPAVLQIVANVQDFQDLSLYIKSDDEVIEVNRDMVQGLFNVEVADLKLAGKRIAEAEKMIPVLSQMGQFRVPANYQWIIKQIYERLGLPDVEKAFEGNIWIPGMIPGGVAGVQGQPNPTNPGTPEPDPNAERLQIRPGPAGDQPQDIGSIPAYEGEA